MSLIFDPSHADCRRASLAQAEARFLRDHAGIDRSKRLAAWREWAAKKLLADFALPADPAARSRLIGQLTAELERMVRQLLDRGWLVDGRLLARVVTDCLAPIAASQRAGKVGDLYPYFRAAVLRYVGANAEEIQQATRRAGLDAATPFGAGLAIALSCLSGPSITEVIAAPLPAPSKPAASTRGRPRKVTGSETAELF